MADAVKPAPARARRTVVAVALCLVCACAASRAWPTDRARIAFSGGPASALLNIYVTNPDGAAFEKLTVSDISNRYPAWSPNGATIAFSSGRDPFDERLYLMGADGRDQRAISDGAGDWGASWSPDGAAIAFTSRRLGKDVSGVYVAYLESGLQTRLTDPETASYQPSWALSGRVIAYDSYRGGFNHLHLMDNKGRHLTQLTDLETVDTSASWHPDEDLLVFHRWNSIDADGIYTMKSDGSDERRVTEHPSRNADPIWSPDGKEILFKSKRDGHDALYITGRNGGAIRRVTDERFMCIWGASWFDPAFPRSVSPVGRHATTWG
ncbi:MAG: hypothetical protein ABGY41_16945 [Candidatus Poribacteria bacterium]